VTTIERLLGALAQGKQPVRQRPVRIDPDQGLGPDQAARRPEQGMAAADIAHFDTVDAENRLFDELRRDELHTVGVGAEAMLSDDKRQRNRVQAENERPFG
jgi:hypothetical protein